MSINIEDYKFLGEYPTRFKIDYLSIGNNAKGYLILDYTMLRKNASEYPKEFKVLGESRTVKLNNKKFYISDISFVTSNDWVSFKLIEI